MLPMRLSVGLFALLLACRAERGAAPPVPAAPPSGASAPADSLGPTSEGGTAPTANTAEPEHGVQSAAPEANAAALLGCGLADPKVAAFLHPEVAGRVPVSVTLPKGIVAAPPPSAAGAEVRFVARGALVEVLELKATSSDGRVVLQIPAEGVHATVACTRGSAGWTSTDAVVVER